MRTSWMKPVVSAAAAMLLALALAGCGSTEEKKDNSTSSSAAKSDTGSGEGIELPTSSGSLKVTMPSGSSAPEITVDATPYSVKETQVKTLKEGDGAVVAADANVSVDYLGVNGRDGKSFDSSYQRGEPVTFPLNGVVPGFAKAIAGQKIGSDVLVAMTPADGYGPQGQPAAGIEADDTLIFFIHINSVA